MRNVLAIVRRDALRLLRVPAAWVIMFGLVFIPPLYAWFNVLGFWNPYGNTLNIRVAVVNEDKGANSEIMGKVNLGGQIVSQLKSNKQLGWQFVDRDEALDQVKSGRSYAAIIIPRDFSKQLSSVVTDGSARPQLQYYVNEKANAIATKVTDTGAATVDKQVNNTFVSTVSKVVSSAVDTTNENLNQASKAAGNQAESDLAALQGNINKARSTISDVSGQLSQVPNQTQQARIALNQADNLKSDAGRSLSSMSTLLSQAQGELNGFIDSSSTNLDQASSQLGQASAQANVAVSQATGMLAEANGGVGSAIAQAKQLNQSNAQIIKDLEDLGLPNTSGIINQLKAQNQSLGQSIRALEQLNADTGATIASTASLADTLNHATQNSLSASGNARKNIIAGTLPQLNNGLNSLSSASGGLGARLSSQGTTIAQAKAILGQLDQATSSTRQSLASTDSYLSGLQGKLTTLSTDIDALDTANALPQVFGKDGKLDAAKVADFMLSPTVLDTKVLYPVASYGSGMAPLFVNLSLWVGAFVLMVIVKLEVDDEGLDDPTPTERYWGRWLLLAPLAALQGVTTTIGTILIGVQTISAPLFVLTGAITSLIYLSIAYALSTTFMHVGKGLCVVLVILQIPGASGLYPIEMMPSFFRRLYPFFPFTYSINALRETIGGFYRNDWAMDLAKLGVFALLFFVLGIYGRPRLNNLNRLFAREIEDSDMLVGEPVERISSEFSLAQALAVLANKDEYRQAIVARATSFARLYPRLKRGALIAGIVVPAILAVTFSFTSGTMVTALAAWVIWILVIIAFLMAIEMMRDHVVRQIRLGTLSEQTIRGMVFDFDRPRRKIRRRRRAAMPAHLPSDVTNPAAKRD
ncbi:YhgE/Pip domain-containing protein [Bifidobacterium actinocoloniiforme]|nr:YhgE/Pip domain-containing protein [Bifidobacterium actinocoloniiforme]AKV55712.1 membrane protein [Bifidobacterium actinocoloniiforme DSM 22766]